MPGQCGVFSIAEHWSCALSNHSPRNLGFMVSVLGAFHLIMHSAQAALRFHSQLGRLQRGEIFNAAHYDAKVVMNILSDADWMLNLRR
jgi:aspartate/tyrosine/aromatic aminotransferase